MSVWALIAAAGSGERLGLDRPKAFAPLNGRPLLAESLERLEGSDWVEQIVVAAPPGWEEPAILLAEELGCGKVVACVPGGATRLDSVRAAAEELGDATVVLVHDAARPLISEAVLERVLTALGNGWDGTVPGLPLRDTVKRVEAEMVVETLDRRGLYAIQTPQAFPAPVLLAALAGEGGAATDCASLVEQRGGRVRVVPGDARLLKVTDAADLELVAAWAAT